MSSRGRAVRVDGPSSRKGTPRHARRTYFGNESQRAPRPASAAARRRPSCCRRTDPHCPRAVEPPNSNQSALWTALVSRHTPPVVAKRVIDFIARGGYAHVLVPVVEDERALNADIAAYGVRVKQVSRTSLYKKPNQASRPIGCSTAKTPSDTR